MVSRLTNKYFFIGITVIFTFTFAIIPQGTIIVMARVKPDWVNIINPYAWLLSNLNNLANVFILGIQNSEIRTVLNAWIRCKSPKVNQATNGTEERGAKAGSREERRRCIRDRIRTNTATRKEAWS